MARSIADMRRLDLPIDVVLTASLPDVAPPDPTWLRSRETFEIEGQIDNSEFQADLVWSVSGLSR